MDRITTARACLVGEDWEADFTATLGLHEEGDEITDIQLDAVRFLGHDLPLEHLPACIVQELKDRVDADSFEEVMQ